MYFFGKWTTELSTSAGGAVVKTFGTGQDEQYNHRTETTLDILLEIQDNL